MLHFTNLKKMFLKSLFDRQCPGTPPWRLRRLCGDTLLMTEAWESPVTRSTPLRGPRTHRVVSWLMLVKDELLKELILLLLRSLEKTKEKKVSSFRKKGLLRFHTLATAIPQPGGQAVLTTGSRELMEEAFGSQPVKLPSSDPCTPSLSPGFRVSISSSCTLTPPLPTMEILPPRASSLSTARCEGLSPLSH